MNDETGNESEYFPGFTVTCNKCKSTDTMLENTMGYSPESGGWGSIDIICNECGNRTEIVES